MCAKQDDFVNEFSSGTVDEFCRYCIITPVQENYSTVVQPAHVKEIQVVYRDEIANSNDSVLKRNLTKRKKNGGRGHCQAKV